MTNVYSAVVSASFSQNTDSLAIEIDVPAGITVKIKKIRVTNDDGTGLSTRDAHTKIMMHTESAGGTGGSTYTAIDLDDNTTPSLCTVKIGPMGPGTLATTIDMVSVHSATDFFWQAADEDDKIVVKPGDIFAIMVNPAF